MKKIKIKLSNVFLIMLIVSMIWQSKVISQSIQVPPLSLSDKDKSTEDFSLMQKPTKKIYYTFGGKIGMFLLQGDYAGNQMIAIELYGKYVGDNFFAELALPIRFKTSPAFTDIGVDVNVLYPFLGPKNKSEVEPYAGGGLGLHFIGRTKEDENHTSIAARGGMGMNLIFGALFFKDYNFNVVLELKYFIYLREFDNLTYQGFGFNVGVTLPNF